MGWKEIQEYPGGIVSDDSHSLEVRHFQVGGHVHLPWHHSCLGSGRGHSNGAAALEPLAVDRKRWGLAVGFTHCLKSLNIKPWNVLFSHYVMTCFVEAQAHTDHLPSHRFSASSSWCRWWAISVWMMGQSSATSNIEISSRTFSSLVSDAKTLSAKARILSSVSVRDSKGMFR